MTQTGLIFAQTVSMVVFAVGMFNMFWAVSNINILPRQNFAVAAISGVLMYFAGIFIVVFLKQLSGA